MWKYVPVVLKNLRVKGVLANLNRFHRSMTRPYFTRDRISHFDNFDLHSDIALKLASKRLAEGHAIDFQV